MTLAASGTDGATNSPARGGFLVWTMLPGIADNLRPDRPFFDAGKVLALVCEFSGEESIGEVGSPLLIFGVDSVIAAPVS